MCQKDTFLIGIKGLKMKIDFYLLIYKSNSFKYLCDKYCDENSIMNFHYHIDTIRAIGFDTKNDELIVYTDSLKRKLHHDFYYVEKIPKKYIPERHVPEWYKY